MGDDQSSAPQPGLVAAPLTSSSAVLAKHILPADIVWIEMLPAHTVGSEQQKKRPWLVVSTKRFNQGALGLIIGVPLSSKIHLLAVSHPSRVRVDSSDVNYQDKTLPVDLKLKRMDRVALCDQVRTLSEKRILARAAQANTRVLDAARAGIAFNLDL